MLASKITLPPWIRMLIPDASRPNVPASQLCSLRLEHSRPPSSNSERVVAKVKRTVTAGLNAHRV